MSRRGDSFRLVVERRPHGLKPHGVTRKGHVQVQDLSSRSFGSMAKRKRTRLKPVRAPVSVP